MEDNLIFILYIFGAFQILLLWVAYNYLRELEESITINDTKQRKITKENK